MRGTEAARGDERGQTLVALSNAIVGIHKRFCGKGPTKARSHLSHDTLTVVLEGGFTQGEHRLHESGHDEELVHARRALQASVEPELRTAVEEILNRRVRSLLTASDPANKLEAIVFVLVPAEAKPAATG